MPDPMIGRLIGGRYRVESKIGSGGMASVYCAAQDVLARKVAIKFLSPELASDATQRERFLREARATNRIRHEHIVDITDYGEEASLVYLVMELLEGEPLNHRVARGPIPPREAIELLMQVSRALARAHELEVIHRDLKPDNIFLTVRNGKAHSKLLDFGLAHVRSEARLTAAGAVFGTPHYLSPEQARGVPNVGPTADLYSLGVVFFEMLTQTIPFDGTTADLIISHINRQPPAPSSRLASIPPEIDAVVLKLMQKDPNQRHRDAYHLLDDLQALLALLPNESVRGQSINPAMTLQATALAEALAQVQSAGRPTPSDDIEVSHPTTVMSSTRSWIERRRAYREATAVAYPRGDAPSWVRDALERIDRVTDRALGLESELDQLGRNLAEREQEASAVRERIGRALDELSRDESTLRRQLDDLMRRLEKARQRAAQSAYDFERAWLSATTLIPDGVLSGVEAANAVELAARRATAWRQGQQEVEETNALTDSRRAAAEDLRFQVSQLKGRLGALNAEVDHEIGGLRERVAQLGGQMATLHEQLGEAGSSVAAHLTEFPAAKSVLQATSNVAIVR